MPSAVRYAPSSLTRGLIDDAAIFPPGLSPLAEAVQTHRELRRSPLARHIGPFLLRASWWQEFAALGTDDDDVDVVLICRPDEDAGDVASAIRGLAEHTEPQHHVRLRGIELPWAGEAAADGTATLLAGLSPDAVVAFEIDGAAADVELAAIARCRRVVTLGKFRTGGIRPEDSPPPERLAKVISAAVRQQVPVKFTAGLHHAVTGPHGPGGSVQFGVLNVMAAVRQAISLAPNESHPTAAVDTLSATLMRTDATSLAAEAMSLDVGGADAIRSVFASFGCCGVTEPLTELAALGVIPDPSEGQQP